MSSRDSFTLYESSFGTGITVHGAIAAKDVAEIIARRPAEIEFNLGKGWRGDDISILRLLPSVESVIVLTMARVDLSPLESHTSLKRLNLETRNKKGVDLSALTGLTRCFVRWAPGFETLFDLPNLEKLGLMGLPLSASQGLTRLTHLKEFRLISSPVRNLSFIQDWQRLRNLSIDGLVKLDDISAISCVAEHLEILNIDTCRRFTSILPIAKCQKLTSLFINNCGEIDSFKALRQCSELHKLTFYETTNIVDGDIASLLNLPNLMPKVFFQNRKHYNMSREELNERLAEIRRH